MQRSDGEDDDDDDNDDDDDDNDDDDSDDDDDDDDGVPVVEAGLLDRVRGNSRNSDAKLACCNSDSPTCVATAICAATLRLRQ